MIIQRNGDLLTSKADVIAHQCNAQGVMGSGVAKQIRDTYPTVYSIYRRDILNGTLTLGHAHFVPLPTHQFIVNMVAQNNYGYDGRRYTSYDAFHDCLVEIASYMKLNNLTSIAFPYNVGCCRGGADWTIISTMIEVVLKDFNIEFWRYDKD